MSTDNGGILAAILWIVTVLLTILAGVISWDMIEPDGFGSFIVFLAIWSVLSSIGHLLAIALTGWIDRML